jgi:WD40 repeat protein
VAFSPDGNRLASASNDEMVRVWDASSGQQLLTLKGHTGEVRAVAFNPGGNRVASAADNHTVKVWDAQTGQEALALKGHTHGVFGVAWSPDGNRLASASGSMTVGCGPSSARERRGFRVLLDAGRAPSPAAAGL